MALIQSTLASALQAVLTGGPEGKDFPGSPDDAGNRWARAYQDYAQGATTPWGAGPSSLGGNLAQDLASAFKMGDASQAARQIVTAIASYWTDGQFQTAPSAPGLAIESSCVVTAIAGTPAAIVTLTSAFQDLGATAAAKAGTIATILDSLTKSVALLASGTAPNGTPLAIPASIF